MYMGCSMRGHPTNAYAGHTKRKRTMTQHTAQIIDLHEYRLDRAARSIDMELWGLGHGGLFEHVEGKLWQLTGDVRIMRVCFDGLAELGLVERVTASQDPLTWIFELTTLMPEDQHYGS